LRQPFGSQEGIMAKTNFPLTIDRRRLLASAAAVTATGILPGVKLADAAAADVPQSSALTHQAEPTNLSAATARRLLDIARRNEIRREAGLPLLSTVKELRHMKEHEDGELRRIEFEQFEAQYQKEVWDAVLRPRREAEGDPNWFPRNWAEGVGYQSDVYKILRERFAAASR
jgi:hypothetical protein